MLGSAPAWALSLCQAAEIELAVLKGKPFYLKVKLTNFSISSIRAAKNPNNLLR